MCQSISLFYCKNLERRVFTMNNNQKAIDILADQIIHTVKTVCSKLEFDKTYFGITIIGRNP